MSTTPPLPPVSGDIPTRQLQQQSSAIADSDDEDIVNNNNNTNTNTNTNINTNQNKNETQSSSLLQQQHHKLSPEEQAAADDARIAALDQQLHDQQLRERPRTRRRSSFFSPSPAPPSPNAREIKAFTDDSRHFSMIRQLHMADYITLMNACCGFMSIVSLLAHLTSEKGLASGNNYYLNRAMLLVPLGLFFDFLDGRVARWRHKASLMGQELDSLADLVSFGVAPASIAYTIGFRTTLDTAALAIFVLCGLTRLARFNVTVANIPKDAKTGKSKYFEGTPIPTTLVLVAIMYYFVATGKTGHTNIPGGVLWDGHWAQVHPLVGLFLISGSAMISKSLKVPKI
ncbi:uncharacterized protein SAPINGB_P006251 [Magnusiomyces paraingens]|uniref:CDP-diacylglycerol--serine O-phosphatidyltransferase n=1 Tax=Magnusiomyces paraingens TaxID=2606893 RepID=A0A5E8C557_9ASCO|nr:uncharacterized protein SAPINGB_P006251 [Saprochaete ingens]VVT58522.1 unnamed protein product [Saprochaete ingens]